MKLRSADDDVTNVTSRQVSGGRRLTEADDAGRWSIDHTDRDVSVLTIDNVRRRDGGLFVCYYMTSARRSAFHVFRLIVTDDKPNTEGPHQLIYIFILIVSERLPFQISNLIHVSLFPMHGPGRIHGRGEEGDRSPPPRRLLAKKSRRQADQK